MRQPYLGLLHATTKYTTSNIVTTLRELKDDIAEKYVVIAELSLGAAEMNKIFLALRSSATMPASASLTEEDGSDDDDDDDDDDLDKDRGSGRGGDSSGGGKRTSRFSRTKRNYGTSSATQVMIDDLLGSRATSDKGVNPTEEPKRGDNTSSHQKKNRLFSFMNRHRRASTGTAKKLRFTASDGGEKRRPSRASRYV